MEIYFDNAATTRPGPEAIAAAREAMERIWGNPSSRHRLGREALALLDDSRRKAAQALGAKPGEIFFTSGGTEADNWALRSGAHLRKKGRVIIGETEHEAVKNPAALLEREGYEVLRLRPDESGAIPLSALEAALSEDTILVSLMMVNNETGAVNPIRELAALTHRRCPRALFHTDAVQAFGKMAFRPGQLGADLVSVSAHKIHGLKGAGALYIREGLRLGPLLLGGGQENEKRSGTEALPAIAAFGAAAETAAKTLREQEERVRLVRAAVLAGMAERVPQATVLSRGGSPYILSISLPGWRAEALLNILDSRGIAVSNSSACRRGRRSEVLTAMGLDPLLVDGALRLSFSGENTVEEAEAFTEALAAALREVRPALR